MVNPKRIEKKLPNLIVNNPWDDNEFYRTEYRLTQFKKKAPVLYQKHRDNLLGDLEKLRKDVDSWFEQNRKR